jgi:16S rRNA (uracil1498-N3)-methyltransferase
VPLAPLSSGDCTLPEATARYVTRVHRLEAGDRFVAFDPAARTEADVEVLHVAREVRCRVGEVRPGARVARPGLTLIQAIGKGDKAEQVIRDATALGVERVVLVEASRSVVKLDAERAGSRRKKWQTVAAEAARQSGRGDIPTIDGPCSLEEALAATREVGCRVSLAPFATSRLAAVLRNSVSQSIALLIGPEGGFDEEELTLADGAGFTRASLGAFVLRTETAAVAALALAALGREP